MLVYPLEGEMEFLVFDLDLDLLLEGGDYFLDYFVDKLNPVTFPLDNFPAELFYYDPL